MRRAVLFFLLVAIQTQAQTNPLFGTWILNVEKSKFDTGQALKSQTRTYEPFAGGQKGSIESVDANGNRAVYGYAARFDGKDYPMTGSGAPGGTDAVALKRIDANTIEATLKKAGQIVGTARIAVSRDGKVLTITRKGAAGGVLIFDKR
jgi:hypothetical protein